MGRKGRCPAARVFYSFIIAGWSRTERTGVFELEVMKYLDRTQTSKTGSGAHGAAAVLEELQEVRIGRLLTVEMDGIPAGALLASVP